MLRYLCPSIFQLFIISPGHILFHHFLRDDHVLSFSPIEQSGSSDIPLPSPPNLLSSPSGRTTHTRGARSPNYTTQLPEQLLLIGIPVLAADGLDESSSQGYGVFLYQVKRIRAVSNEYLLSMSFLKKNQIVVMTRLLKTTSVNEFEGKLFTVNATSPSL